MTGYGDSRVADDHRLVAVEIRTVNNRYLKVSLRSPDYCSPLESRIEKLIRKSITRGTVSVSIRIERLAESQDVSINKDLVKSLWKQLESLASEMGTTYPTLESLLVLPGLVQQKEEQTTDLEAIWTQIEPVIKESLDKLKAFREEEGQSMETDLLKQTQLIETELAEIEKQAPQVVTAYRDKLLERVTNLLEETSANIESNDLIREVSIFADRCDINEEITRLRCHISQMREFMSDKNSQGRKLEFLCQEMLREVNTIGSKANQVQIAHGVVEMKGAVEKMREISQNIE